MILRAVVAWLAILVLAIGNGMLRESVLLPHLGKPAALIASGALLAAMILLVAIALARWLGLGSGASPWSTGALWLGLTVVFEFGFGIARGRSWAEMLAPYRFEDGNVWPLVLAMTFFAPLIASRLRSSSA